MSSRTLRLIQRFGIPGCWLAVIGLAALTLETRGRLLVHTDGRTLTRIQFVLFCLAFWGLCTWFMWTFSRGQNASPPVVSMGVATAAGTLVTLMCVLILRLHARPSQAGPVSSEALAGIMGELLAGAGAGFVIGAILEGLRQQFSPDTSDEQS